MPSTIYLSSGKVIGIDDGFTPADGDASTGGNGQTVDGIPCGSMTDGGHHVHFFLGVLVNGVQYAIPDTIGMHVPATEVNGFTSGANCVYQIHTHDASGMIHVEAGGSVPLNDPVFNLGDLFDIWGQSISSTGFANFTGPVHVFYATTPLRSAYSGTYKPYTGNPRAIQFYSHEAIWIEIGTKYLTQTQLPRIHFYTEY